ncbi:MAG: hypothetical protein AB1656_14095 [Candidatus Omnitrophota bacterium]
MRRSIYLLMMALFAGIACAQDIVVDSFEGYADDFALQDAWKYSRAGGPQGLFIYLDDQNNPPDGSKCLFMDVDMAEKWWYNTERKELDNAPLDVSKYLSVQFMFFGDADVVPGKVSFTVFLYDSVGRAMRFGLPAEYVTNPAWQKVTLSIDSFSQEEWDAGYGTDAPDADKSDIIAIGLMVVTDDVNQLAQFYVDNIVFKEKPENLLIDDFESYADDFDLKDAWPYTKAGGPDGLFAYLDQSNAPQGSKCLFMDVDMPEKWWHNILKKTIPEGPLNLSSYSAVDFMFYGDADVVPGQTIFTVFLYDSTGRALRFALPNDYVTNPSWQKLTLSLSSFSEEEWDAGYGTDAPDANKGDIVSIGLMMVGDAVNQVAQFYVDDIQFVSQTAAATVTGTIMEGDAPLEGVTVYAIDQTSMKDATTGPDGVYLFSDLSQGKQYRLIPILKDYDFTPNAETLTLFNDSYTQDFTGAPSAYNALEKTALQDQFDESGLNASIVYRGAREWFDAQAGDVRPIMDVTVDKTYDVAFPDAAGGQATLFAIQPNSQAGASSPKFALEVGSSYGWDMLAFGRNTDANYFVEVDAYCDVRYDIPLGSGFDRISLGVHCSIYDPGKPALDAYADTNAYRNSGGYAISFETDTGDIAARKYGPSNDKAHAKTRMEGFATEYGKVTIADSGWHRFRIECLNNHITFFVDGKKIAETDDEEFPFGPAGLHYRACFSDGLADLMNINHARFDNLKTGPTAAGIDDWMLN